MESDCPATVIQQDGIESHTGGLLLPTREVYKTATSFANIGSTGNWTFCGVRNGRICNPNQTQM
jgi:hypothetical protein